MSILTKAQKLKIHAAALFDNVVVAGTFFVTVRLGSIRNVGAGQVDIYMLEQIVVHEIVVALVIISIQSFILIQVNIRYTGEI